MENMRAHTSKIVLIDDDVELVAVLKTVLRDEGYQVVCYYSPQFIDRFLIDKPDAVIVDVWFEGIADGLNEVKAMNFQEKLGGVPIILISSDPQIAQYAQLVQAARYLSKPFDLTELLATVQQVVP